MKRKMNSWLKRSLAGLLCMSLMVFCMLPVSAVSDHSHDYVKEGDSYSSVWSYNEAGHTIITSQRYACTWLGCKENYSVEIDRVTEVHDIVYTDLGEVNGMHRYRVECKVCGFHYEL